MIKYKVLIVDDEEDILEFLSFNLVRENYEVKTARNGKEAMEYMDAYSPDLILLDIMMPVMDGISFCTEIRKKTKFDSVAIIFLTARTDEEIQIKSLDLGGDDFIQKPVSIKVLLSRIKAIIRRRLKTISKETSNEILEFDDLVINPLKMEVVFHTRKLEFAKKEFLLLYLLASHPGKVFKRTEILEKIWGNDVIVGDRTIDVHIRKIREKLEDLFIKTIKGVGYKFEI